MKILLFTYRPYSSLLSVTVHLQTTHHIVIPVDVCSIPHHPRAHKIDISKLLCDQDLVIIRQYWPMPGKHFPYVMGHKATHCSRFAKWGTEVSVTGNAVFEKGELFLRQNHVCVV